MLIIAARVSGFRSFRKPVEIFLSPRTTVLIGPNDHGKTNLLLAIERFSPEKEFSATDLNDRVRGEDAFIEFQLGINDAEINTIEAGIQQILATEIALEEARFA